MPGNPTALAGITPIIGGVAGILWLWGSYNDLTRLITGKATQTAVAELLAQPSTALATFDGAVTIYTSALYCSRALALYGLFCMPSLVSGDDEALRKHNRKKKSVIAIPLLLHTIEVLVWFARLARGEDRAGATFTFFNAMFMWNWAATATGGHGNPLRWF